MGDVMGRSRAAAQGERGRENLPSYLLLAIASRLDKTSRLGAGCNSTATRLHAA